MSRKVKSLEKKSNELRTAKRTNEKSPTNRTKYAYKVREVGSHHTIPSMHSCFISIHH